MAGNADYAVSFFIRAKHQAGAAIRSFKRDLSSMRGQAAAFSRSVGFHRVAASAERLWGAFRGMGAPLQRVVSLAGRVVAPMAALASGGLIAGTAALAHRTAEYGDELAKLSARTGLSVRRLQELEFAFTQGGAAQEEARSGLRDFIKNIGEAAAGTGEAKDLIEAMNVSLESTPGKMRPVNDVLLDVADRLMAIEDPATRNAVAMKLFGDSGVALLNTLQEGRGGIEAYAKDLRRLGYLTEEQARYSEQLKARKEELTRATTALGGAVLTQVMPALEPMLAWLTDMVVANRELIAQNLGAVMTQAVQAVQAVDWPGVITNMRLFIQGVVETVQWLGGWGNAALIVAGIMHADLLVATARVAVAMTKLGVQIALTTARAAFLGGAKVIGALRLFFGLTRRGIPIWAALGRVIRRNPIGAFITLALAAVPAIIAGWRLLANWFASLDLFGGIRESLADFIESAPKLVREAFGVDDETVAAIRGTRKSDAEKAAARAELDKDLGRLGDLAKQTVNDLSPVDVFDRPSTPDLAASPVPSLAPAPVPTQSAAAQAQVVVRFENAPAGLRVQTGRQSAGVDVTTEVEVGRGTVGATL